MSAQGQRFLDETANYIGAEFFVATSQYSCSKATGYWSEWKTVVHPSTLRSLESAGYIKILDSFWRGARVRRIK